MKGAWKSKLNPMFRSKFSEDIFNHKYRHEGSETWAALAKTLVEDVCRDEMSRGDKDQLFEYIRDMKFLPGGRYLYYAGRPNKFFNNCYLLRAEEDSREDWANLSWKAESCLMTGGGIGVDYSVYRGEGAPIARTGGQASGPIPKMNMINEIGRRVMQGGSRRCLGLNEIVSTDQGAKRIKDIVVGDMVKTNSGYRKVLAVECTGEKPLLEISTRAGIIYSTEDHRHAVVRSIEPFHVEWVEARNLTHKDTLVFYVDRSLGVGGKLLTPFEEVDRHFNAKPYTRPEKMSTELAWFLGALCDGSCVESGVTFSQRESNIEFLHKVQDIFKDTFGCDSALTQGNKVLDCRVNRRQLSKDLSRYRAKNGGRLIHDDILNASFEEKLAFVAGVLDADGTLSTTEGEREKGTVVFRFACSKDETWIKDLSKLLSSMGIPNRVGLACRGQDTTRNPIWHIRLADKDFADTVAGWLRPYSIKVNKVYQDVGRRNQAAHALVATRSAHNTPRVMNPMDYRSFVWPEGVVPARIEKIIRADADITYDIQVEGDECFVANGHLTHNSAIYASLNWQHADAQKFLRAKDWADMPVAGTGKSLWDIKQVDFNFPAPLDMTNISLNYDTKWLLNYYKTGDYGSTFLENVRQALTTAEPGFSFNFFDKEMETLRNACCEVVSADDSDVCNLGSLNLGRIKDINELRSVVKLSTMFLICGTLRADLPYEKVAQVRAKNRRLGLGLMGVHEWLIQRGHRYEVVPELHHWLSVYKGESDAASQQFADALSISRPVANRAIAPTGSIGILAGTSTGIEPIFAVAYKRRYLKGGHRWHYQYVVDSAAQELISLYGADPDKVESALDLAQDYERRIKFQADVQDYVDMAISSTINIPARGTKHNNEDTDKKFAETLAKYAPRLRGFTCYPDGSRGGQPLASVPYQEAVDKLGEEFEEYVETHDICDISGSGGTCGS